MATPHAHTIENVCREIESAEQMPSLAELARLAGMSQSHLHRLFKQATGLTPRQYAAEVRAKRIREGLPAAGSVTEAVYSAGFQSPSRFYESAEALLGMKPTEFREHGARNRIHFAVGGCSLGSVLVAASERGVCAIMLGDDPEELVIDLQRRFRNAELIGGDTGFERLVAVVVGFVEEPCKGFDLPLDIRGTAFQQRVWKALREVPPGETASYAEIARRIGSPAATRAVAGACAANPIAVAIPCHRVVRTDGGLSGYRWGVERKRELLRREHGCEEP
jgi:AraC family transcriptional regulator of adaptative response/methylated-DNA-[protein]-cysteine methyltransferase